MVDNFKGAVVWELDTNNDVMMTWVYPEVKASPELRTVIERKIGLSDGTPATTQSSFGKFQETWHYTFTAPLMAFESTGVRDAVAVAVTVLSEDFFPEKYLALSKNLTGHYAGNGDATLVLKSILSIELRGVCARPECTFAEVSGETAAEFKATDYLDVRMSYLSAPIKTVVSKFGVQSILVYIAVLLKKRIVVVNKNVPELLQYVRTIPQFVYKRQDWGITFPFVDAAAPEELADLQNAGGAYIAGFTDASIQIREDLYDILLDCASGEILIASQATDTFKLGKVHKEIAMYMVEAAGDGDESAQGQLAMVKELVARSDMLLDGLKKLASPSDEDESKLVVTAEAIRARKMPASMHVFLQNLAVAEGMLA